MSGIKDVYVSMTRTERDSLIRNARVAQENAEQAAYRQRQAQNALNQANNKINSLNNTLNSEIQGLHSEINRMAREQNARLSQQANSFNRKIEELRSQMDSNKKELEDAISNIQDSIQAKEQNHCKIAEFWISQTEAFFKDIEQYRHELFAPNQLSLYRMQLNQVQSDMQVAAYESAISTSRNIFNQTVQLKERIVQAEIEWSHYYSQLQDILAEVKSDINFSRTMQFTIPTEEGDCTIDANIDYWTNDGLKYVIALVDRIDERLLHSEELSTNELISMIKELKNYKEQIKLLQERAKTAIISSQMRADIAGTMTDALMGAGWTCSGYTYEESEEKQPLHIKFADGNGNEIVAIISPDEMSENLANNLAINFFDPYNNDESLRGLWIDSIKNTLKETGLDVGQAVCRPGYEVKASDNEAIRNLEQTARKSN